MPASTWIDAFQRRHRWAALPVAVVQKFVDDECAYLAALMTYYGFVSLFPLLLLGVSTLGFALRDDPAAQQAVLSSALRNFPVIGDQLRANVQSLQGSWAAIVIGFVVALYGALGVTHATQNALNRVWAVPKAARPSIQAAYGRGLLMVVLVGLGFLATAVLSGTATTASGILGLSGLARLATVLLSTALTIGLFLSAYRVLAARRLPLRRAWVGSVIAAVTWQGVLAVGAHLLATRLQGAGASYGLFGIVLGLLAWIYVAAGLFVVCAEIDAVLVQRLYPRSLRSAYPDDHDTTPADRRAYTAYAQIERQKDHQSVDVTFDRPGPPDPST